MSPEDWESENEKLWTTWQSKNVAEQIAQAVFQKSNPHDEYMEDKWGLWLAAKAEEREAWRRFRAKPSKKQLAVWVYEDRPDPSNIF